MTQTVILSLLKKRKEKGEKERKNTFSYVVFLFAFVLQRFHIYIIYCQTWASLFSTLEAGQRLFTYEWLIEKYLPRSSSWQKYETVSKNFICINVITSAINVLFIMFVMRYKDEVMRTIQMYGKYDSINNFN